jgi:transcriptional regulator with XRE-family HTH domain
MDKISFGRKITQKRESLGESQTAFGRRFGVSQQAVFSWETGLTVPGRSNLDALCSLIGVPVEKVMLMRKQPTIETEVNYSAQVIDALQNRVEADQQYPEWKNTKEGLIEMLAMKNEMIEMMRTQIAFLKRDNDELRGKLAALQAQAPKKKVM